jgi:hypothetical protein
VTTAIKSATMIVFVMFIAIPSVDRAQLE